MSTLQASKNSPVEGGKDLLFLISLMDKQDKVEFVKQFKEDFLLQVEEKKLSRTGYYKLLQGYAPSDERLAEIVEMDEKARKWLIERVKEKAERALQIIERMEVNGE
uniref:ORF106a n=1 Tax=Saccharolobus islandicus TaxID=43080 RepID=Q9C4X0_SACIS|nr:hypothetical protein [Sulfolobus islandicus]AAK06922.1 ORF106a [Sulfolobus islandicus]